MQMEYFDFHENETYIKENKLISNGKHLPYNPKLIDRAKSMRKDMTSSELKLRLEFLQTLTID